MTVALRNGNTIIFDTLAKIGCFFERCKLFVVFFIVKMIMRGDAYIIRWDFFNNERNERNESWCWKNERRRQEETKRMLHGGKHALVVRLRP
ncbi:hypothetical protein HMPREF1640_02760 [Prevotella sp. S7-1-8]|nr:hypothetical protein HMPREF1640_02760 [Prevotella sp. S7-1-8]